MAIVLYVVLLGYALLNFMYAFKEPPAALKSFLKIPSIFVFLPNHLVVPVGRIFTGCMTLFLLIFIYVKTSGF